MLTFITKNICCKISISLTYLRMSYDFRDFDGILQNLHEEASHRNALADSRPRCRSWTRPWRSASRCSSATGPTAWATTARRSVRAARFCQIPQPRIWQHLVKLLFASCSASNWSSSKTPVRCSLSRRTDGERVSKFNTF